MAQAIYNIIFKYSLETAICTSDNVKCESVFNHLDEAVNDVSVRVPLVPLVKAIPWPYHGIQ